MKKIELKKPNIDISAKLPYILVGASLVVGVLIVFFAYFLFNRNPEDSFVSSAQSEVDNISINFNKKTSSQLFDSSYYISNVKDPGFSGKNPFLGF